MNEPFSQITETPGIGATREQLSMLVTRYGLAVKHADGRQVLEVACGTGIGLGLLADASDAVVGCDIDPDNVRVASATWGGDRRIRVEAGDVAHLAYADGTFGTVVCFEALYYFSDLCRSLAEMIRVLSPAGKLVLCTVNPGWSGFCRSPYSREYPTPASLSPLLRSLGCRVQVWGGFADAPRGLASRILGVVRKVAVRLHLVPGSMRGKELLKKLFLGGTIPMPARLTRDLAHPEPLTSLPEDAPGTTPVKVFYLVATKIS